LKIHYENYEKKILELKNVSEIQIQKINMKKKFLKIFFYHTLLSLVNVEVDMLLGEFAKKK